MESGDGMSLQTKMTSLASACRKRFGGTSKLSIDDMIKLVTPPPIVDGMDLLKGQPIQLTADSDGGPIYTYSGKLATGIPDHGKPITMKISLSGKMHAYYYGQGATNSTLTFESLNGAIKQVATVKYPASDSSKMFQDAFFTDLVTFTLPALQGQSGMLDFKLTLDAKRNGTVMEGTQATVKGIYLYN